MGIDFDEVDNVIPYIYGGGIILIILALIAELIGCN